MKLTVDASIVLDSRYALVAQDVGRDRMHVFGAWLVVSLSCLERGTPALSIEAIDALSGIPGFAIATVRHGLATERAPGTIGLLGDGPAQPAQAPSSTDVRGEATTDGDYTTLTDFARAAAAAGLSIQISGMDRARWGKLQPVAPWEAEHAIDRGLAAHATRAGYLLSVIEGERERSGSIPDRPAHGRKPEPDIRVGRYVYNHKPEDYAGGIVKL